METSIPYEMYDALQKRFDRIIHKLIIALVTSMAITLISNALWLWAFTQYEYITDETQIITKDGVANYIGNDGVINGKDD